MKKNKYVFLVFIIGIIIYYLVPYMGGGITESSPSDYGSICVYFINSVYAVSAGFVLTNLKGFKWYFAPLIGLLFIPASLIYFNKTTAIYSLLYMLETMVGCSLSIKYYRR